VRAVVAALALLLGLASPDRTAGAARLAQAVAAVVAAAVVAVADLDLAQVEPAESVVPEPLGLTGWSSSNGLSKYVKVSCR
jgi:hypothetical protein